MTNHVDRFYAAVTVLAGDGHVKQRLADAYTQHLTGIHGSDLPPTVQEQFTELRRRLHTVASQNGEGPVLASVRKMSGHDAAECAVGVVAIYAELTRLAGKTRRRGDDVDAEAVAPFLVKSGAA